MPKRGQEVATRKRREAFLERLQALGEGPECVLWPWTSTKGYVFIRGDDGRMTTAHRWVLERLTGPLGELEACHACDNPPCVRPSHLWRGSHGQNLRDAYRKGRKKANKHPRPGVLHHNARLTEDQVYAIRSLADQGVAHPIIAATFGVSRPLVSLIGRRKRWGHLPEEPTT